MKMSKVLLPGLGLAVLAGCVVHTDPQSDQRDAQRDHRDRDRTRAGAERGGAAQDDGRRDGDRHRATGQESAFWTFDEGRGTTAVDQVSGTQGVVHDAVWERHNIAPVADNAAALRFDGDGAHVDTEVRSLDLGITDEATVTAWVYIDDLSDSGHADIVSDWDGSGRRSGDGFTLRVGSSGELVFYAYPGDHRAQSDDGLFTEGRWHFIAGVIDRDSVYVYLDGQLVGRDDFEGTLGDSGRTIKIGGRGELRSRFFASAIIDEVAIYNRALPERALAP